MSISMGRPRTSRSEWGDEGNERRRNKKSRGASGCVVKTHREAAENSVEADPMFSKVQGQLTYVDQEARLQLVYETGQRPEERIATLGLVPRDRV